MPRQSYANDAHASYSGARHSGQGPSHESSQRNLLKRGRKEQQRQSDAVVSRDSIAFAKTLHERNTGRNDNFFTSTNGSVDNAAIPQPHKGRENKSTGRPAQITMSPFTSGSNG